MKKHRILAVLTLPTLLSAALPIVAHAATSTSTTSSQTRQTLKAGTKGFGVVALQNDLNALGFTVGEADGVFGQTTTTQVKAFQTKHHMTADGVVGPGTWSALDKAMAAFVSQPVTLSSSSKLVTHLETKHIYFNHQLITSPSGFTYKNTDYMPIWYVMNTLDQMGLSHTWSNNVWNIIIPNSSGLKVDYSKIQYGKGSTSIAINGTVVARVDGAVHVDPASGKATMFMPTWYVMNALKRTGITSGWQGNTWDMTPPTGSTLGPNKAGAGRTGPGTPVGTATGGSGSKSNGNTTSGYTTSGNTTSGNTTSGNTTSGNTTSGNTTSGNTTSGNTTSVTTTPPKSFTNVDLRFPAPGNVNQSTIDKYLLSHNSPMNGLGSSFIEAQNTYEVDANYLVSHAILESYWGQSQIALAKNNLFGYGAYDANPGTDAGKFPSDDYAIRFQAWEVRNNYLTSGSSLYVTPTLKGMNVHYATDPRWASSIGGLMAQFANSVGSSVNDYPQYPNPTPVPQPNSTDEPVYYFSGATAVVQPDPYYPITASSTTTSGAVNIGSTSTSPPPNTTVNGTSNTTTNTPGNTTTSTTTNAASNTTSNSTTNTSTNSTTNTTTSTSTTGNTGVPYFPDMATGMREMFFGPLKQGSSGEPVGEVQTYLNTHNHAGLTVDGQYGPKTVAAVKQFQATQGLPQDGIWSYQMWTTYIGSLTTQPLIPAGTSVTIDQVKEGMAGGYVVPWYHVPNFGWVDSQYIQFSDVYRLEVSDPAGTDTSIPVYSTANSSQKVGVLHSGDFVVAQSSTPVNGWYQIQFAAQTMASSGGKTPGTAMVGLVPANGQYSLVSQS